MLHSGDAVRVLPLFRWPCPLHALKGYPLRHQAGYQEVTDDAITPATGSPRGPVPSTGRTGPYAEILRALQLLTLPAGSSRSEPLTRGLRAATTMRTTWSRRRRRSRPWIQPGPMRGSISPSMRSTPRYSPGVPTGLNPDAEECRDDQRR